MNFFKLYIGDYQRDTAHLSVAENGAYLMMLQYLYATEKGIPDDQRYRVARARSDEEREAVDTVLNEFFTLHDGIWRQDRCDREIALEKRKRAALKDLQERDEYRKFRDLVLSRDGERCAYCGATEVPLQLDHVIPRSRGGSDLPENLTPACRPCNASKGARTPEEWRQS